VLAAVAGWLPADALAYGPAGHRVAGRLAEPLLCRAAAAEIASLTGGEGLDELGLWADRIRGDDAWRHTNPWHYMNIEDDARIESFAHPPEGDVLWAIEGQAGLLARPGAPAARAEALRFLVHFVVDIHQPLHVGRESDRGGNTVDVRAVGGPTVNLHRFWDTDVLQIAGLDERDYQASLEPAVRMLAAAESDDRPAAWAAESLALRESVYAFPPAQRGASLLDERYLDRADFVTRLRLAQAAVRLAAALNRILAPGQAC